MRVVGYRRAWMRDHARSRNTVAPALILVASACLSLPGSGVGAGAQGSDDPQDSSACTNSACIERVTLRAWRQFDASTCKENAHDRFYIALGRNVLGLPHTTGAIMLGAIYPGMKLNRFKPLDPTDREGCLANPLQLQSLVYEYWIDTVRSAKSRSPQQKTPRPDALELIRIADWQAGVSPRGDGWDEWEGPEWGGEQIQLGDARRRCKDAAVREQLPNGMTACRVKPSINDPVENWATSYVAMPEIYKAPLGEKFLVNCGPGLFTSAIGHCDVSYVLASQLGLTYRFQPYLGLHPIPIDDVIDFDRGLRASIEASLIKDYQWPEDATGEQPAKPDAQPQRQ